MTTFSALAALLLPFCCSVLLLLNECHFGGVIFTQHRMLSARKYKISREIQQTFYSFYLSIPHPCIYNLRIQTPCEYNHPQFLNRIRIRYTDVCWSKISIPPIYLLYTYTEIRASIWKCFWAIWSHLLAVWIGSALSLFDPPLTTLL